jgi:hypothetical protein
LGDGVCEALSFWIVWVVWAWWYDYVRVRGFDVVQQFFEFVDGFGCCGKCGWGCEGCHGSSDFSGID